jgi:hypothetical protein
VSVVEADSTREPGASKAGVATGRDSVCGAVVDEAAAGVTGPVVAGEPAGCAGRDWVGTDA